MEYDGKKMVPCLHHYVADKECAAQNQKWYKNEFLFEFTNGFRVKNIALVHLHDQGFKLISHGVSLSCEVSPS